MRAIVPSLAAAVTVGACAKIPPPTISPMLPPVTTPASAPATPAVAPPAVSTIPTSRGVAVLARPPSPPTSMATVGPGSASAPSARTCQELAGFAAAQPPKLANLSFPKGTLVVAAGSNAAAGGAYSLQALDACTPDNTPDLVTATGKGPLPFARMVGFYGWGASPAFPYDGATQTLCAVGDQCFAYTRGGLWLALQHLEQLANGLVTYKVLFAQKRHR